MELQYGWQGSEENFKLLFIVNYFLAWSHDLFSDKFQIFAVDLFSLEEFFGSKLFPLFFVEHLFVFSLLKDSFPVCLDFNDLFELILGEILGCS